MAASGCGACHNDGFRPGMPRLEGVFGPGFRPLLIGLELALWHSMTERISFNDSLGFEGSVLPLAPALYRRAFALCRDPDQASDLVQETVVRAFRYWPTFRGGTNLKAWLRRILTNTFINSYRSDVRRRRLASSLSEVQSTMVNEQAPEDGEFGDEVRGALAGLRPEFREVLLLVDVQQLSYAEVAEKMGCPIGTVMSRLHRARASMRQDLTDYARVEGYVRNTEPADAGA